MQLRESTSQAHIPDEEPLSFVFMCGPFSELWSHHDIQADRIPPGSQKL
jgi:hypothetical protein